MRKVKDTSSGLRVRPCKFARTPRHMTGFWPGGWNWILILRKHQTTPSWGTFYDATCCVLQKCLIMKKSTRPRTVSRLTEVKEPQHLNAERDSGVGNAGKYIIGRNDKIGSNLWSREKCYICGKVPELMSILWSHKGMSWSLENMQQNIRR